MRADPGFFKMWWLVPWVSSINEEYKSKNRHNVGWFFEGVLYRCTSINAAPKCCDLPEILAIPQSRNYNEVFVQSVCLSFHQNSFVLLFWNKRYKMKKKYVAQIQERPCTIWSWEKSLLRKISEPPPIRVDSSVSLMHHDPSDLQIIDPDPDRSQRNAPWAFRRPRALCYDRLGLGLQRRRVTSKR